MITLLLATGLWGAERHSSYHVVNWQVEDGLPQNTIHRITQTSDGYLWLATTKEVVRFDGLEFRTLTSNGAVGPDFSGVTCLYGDRTGGLWIGTSRGLIRYSAGKFTQIKAPEALNLGKIHSVSQAPDGQLYVAAEFELFHVESGRLRPMATEHPDAPKGGVALTTDSQNHLWVAWGNTLYRFNEGQWSTEAQFPKIINSVAEDRNGTIWCGLNGGYLAWLTPGNEPNLKYFDGGSIFEIAGNQADEVLFRISDRLHLFPKGNNLPLLLQNREPLERIQYIFTDRDQNVWLGTKGKGLVLLQPQPLATYSTEEGLSYPDVKTVEQLDDNNIWLGTMGGGLANLSEESFAPIESIDSLNITSIRRLSNGKLWVGTYGNHLWQIDQGTPSVETRSRALAGRCLFEDAEGGLWIGGEGMGAERILADAVLRLDTGNGLVSDNVRCFAQDQSGAIWIGTDRGLHCYVDEALENHTHQLGLRDARIQTLFVDSDGTLWIGTESRGLTRYQQEQFKTVRTEVGLLSESIAQIIEDDYGYLWLGTNRRLYRTKLNAINAFFSNQADRLIGKSFGKEEGMLSQECSGGFQPNCLKASDGTLWFCTANGVVRADPASDQSSADPPEIHIDLFLADGIPVPRDTPLSSDAAELNSKLGMYDSSQKTESNPNSDSLHFTVPAGASRLEIHYTGINLAAPASVHYRYRLKNYDSDWTLVGSQSVAAYTHVAPGDYRFEVQASNSDGVWNPVSANIEFRVEPRLIQTWWFKGGIGLVVGATLFALTYGPIHRRRQLARLRLQIARDLHDEVGSELASISLYSELANAKSGRKSEATDEFAEIDRIVRRTSQSLRDVIWFTNPKFDTLGGLQQQMEDTANLMLVGRKIVFDSERSSSDRKLPLLLRRQIFLIFREIMHNILKHSQAKRVEISIFHSRNTLSLHVSDDGVGFSPDDNERGNGLNNMEQRATEMNGRVRFQTQPGQGMTIDLELPLF